MAEALLNHWGRGSFRGFSAGSFPTGRVNPLATALLERVRIPAGGARSKSWDEFAKSDAVGMDFVFTVCDKAAGEVCPVWPGQPVSGHWGVEDPAAVEGSDVEKAQAFRRAFNTLAHRIKAFVSLPLASLDRARLQKHVQEIGRLQPSDEA
jgi:arsenate reductase (thioredoxin)